MPRGEGGNEKSIKPFQSQCRRMVSVKRREVSAQEDWDVRHRGRRREKGTTTKEKQTPGAPTSNEVRIQKHVLKGFPRDNGTHAAVDKGVEKTA